MKIVGSESFRATELFNVHRLSGLFLFKDGQYNLLYVIWGHFTPVQAYCRTMWEMEGTLEILMNISYFIDEETQT